MKRPQQPHIRVRHLAGLAALVLAIGSCNDRTPVAPTPGPQPGPTVVVSTLRLELDAPSEIAPDESVQLGLKAIKSDGSVEDVTSRASWNPTNSPFLQITPTGLATGKARGSTTVFVTFDRRNVSQRVIVVPKGTFRLTGTVKESGFGIANVAINVLSGAGQGLTALTTTNGAFELYGVAGAVQLHLKKEGYQNGLQQLDVTSHRNADFEILADRPRKNYSGNYQLTISAASSCATGNRPLPEAARRRTYSATVTQDGARLTVTLGDADFIVTDGHGNRFFGYVDPDDLVTFPIGDAYYYYYYSGHFDIVERLSNTSALAIVGTLSSRATSTSLSGTMNGALMVSSRSTPPFTSFSSQCFSNSHQFEMLRR